MSVMDTDELVPRSDGAFRRQRFRKIAEVMSRVLLVTARKRSLRQGNIFATCLSFCSQKGGLPQCMLRYPLARQTPLQQGSPPWQGRPSPGKADPPGRADPLARQTPLTRWTPPRQTPPLLLCSACWEIRSASGRYASYYNAILVTSIVLKVMDPE